MRTLTVRRPFAPLALAATLLAAFVFLFAWPQSASAHDALVASNPAEDSTVETLPEELTLTFSAALIDGEGTTALSMTDGDGNSVTDGEPTVDGAMVTQPLVAEAAAGVYLVNWHVVSSDGHPTEGEFSFTVMTSTLPEATTPATTEPSAEPTPEPSAEPTAIATETSVPAVTQVPDADASAPATGWVWALSIVGILIIAGVAVWLVARRGRVSPSADSDAPTER